MIEPGHLRCHVVRSSVVQHLHEIEYPGEFIVLTSVLYQLDKNLIEFELFRCDLIGSQFIGAKCIPQSVKVERLDSESTGFVNILTRPTQEDCVLLFHWAFLRICSPERHAEWQVLDERSRPARMLLPSLAARVQYMHMIRRRKMLTFKIRHMRFPSVTPTGQYDSSFPFRLSNLLASSTRAHVHLPGMRK